jgi:hypothetical protein
MKVVYCEECGTKLAITRRAVKGNIIDTVTQHVCPSEPVELDLNPVFFPSLEKKSEPGKFVKNLNELTIKTTSHGNLIGKVGSLDSNDLRDRRFEAEPVTSAPKGVIETLKSLEGPTEDDESEMGG